MVAQARFVVHIPESIYNEMLAHIVAGYPNEACGALGSKDGTVLSIIPPPTLPSSPTIFQVSVKPTWYASITISTPMMAT